jgi:2-polyprenyl-6-methoxyphenol hydroxylase-like FAD-dependent oxidoreductase
MKVRRMHVSGNLTNSITMIPRQLGVVLTRTNHTRRRCRAGFSTKSKGERMRVAIVGGGVSGLSSALHLAPLVAQGYISGPIDVFDTSKKPGREVGVGIWSTALDPFHKNTSVDSHQLVYRDMTQQGTFVRDVGYRTPKGHWLAQSRLEGELPDLLFLRETDLLKALRKAVHLEEQRGTVVLHTGKTVDSVGEESPEPWSAPLLLGDSKTKTPRDYHLIVAADGTNSALRKMYGGHICKRGTLAGDAPPMSSPLDLPKYDYDAVKDNWHVTGQAEATSTQDRQYTVFRGNAPLSSNDTIGENKSFQTWGEGRSMRFATVPMMYPTSNGQKEERQVWFITINDDEITSEPDPTKRRDLLLQAFDGWHDPIRQLVEATPPDDILMERAVAHKHTMSPVANFNSVVQQMRKKQPPTSGNGPAIVFVGDAFMTIDPILAQGFTIGMEGAAGLATCLEATHKAPPRPEYPKLSFDPYVLRNELKLRHDNRIHRLICLLRATELVQALGQPTTGTLSGIISRDIIRPLMRLTPGFIKTPVFDFMLKYSLGSPQRRTSNDGDDDKK